MQSRRPTKRRVHVMQSPCCCLLLRSVTDCLRMIRNKRHHFNELSPEVRSSALSCAPLTSYSQGHVSELSVCTGPFAAAKDLVCPGRIPGLLHSSRAISQFSDHPVQPRGDQFFWRYDTWPIRPTSDPRGRTEGRPTALQRRERRETCLCLGNALATHRLVPGRNDMGRANQRLIGSHISVYVRLFVAAITMLNAACLGDRYRTAKSDAASRS